jgi:hypothetical protein
MKRILIFGLLGTSMWAVGATGLFVFVLYGFSTPRTDYIAGAIAFLPVAFKFSLIPAVAFCAVDAILERISLRPFLRMEICAAIGFCTPMLYLVTRSPSVVAVIAFGLLGAIPATFCSWLSSRAIG